MKIKNISIGDREEVFVIAEIGINHNGKAETAKKMLEEASRSGAAAVKLQTYVTEKRVKKDSPIFGLLKECELDFSALRELRRTASDLGLVFGSTPFDRESIEMLGAVNADFIKIASMDSRNYDLIDVIIAKKKPVIASCGMSTRNEIIDLASRLKNNENGAAILHCVSSYPVEAGNSNLGAIRELKKIVPYPIGYSDHTIGHEVAVLAVVAGACLIEKHFTLDTAMPGPDHKLSANPEIMREIVSGIKKVKAMLGSGELIIRECEKAALQFKRISD